MRKNQQTKCISPEDRFIGHLDEIKIRDSFYLSVASTLARSPKAESELAPYGKKIVEYLEQFGDANCLKLEREINVKFFGKAAAIRHAEERLFERLKPSLREFDAEPAIRSKTSWRASCRHHPCHLRKSQFDPKASAERN